MYPLYRIIDCPFLAVVFIQSRRLVLLLFGRRGVWADCNLMLHLSIWPSFPHSPSSFSTLTSQRPAGSYTPAFSWWPDDLDVSHVSLDTSLWHFLVLLGVIAPCLWFPLLRRLSTFKPATRHSVTHTLLQKKKKKMTLYCKILSGDVYISSSSVCLEFHEKPSDSCKWCVT